MSFKRKNIPILDNPSPEEFSEYLLKNQPALIKNAIQWKLTKEFNLDKITSVFGNRQYITIVSKHGLWADEATYVNLDNYNYANTQQEERKLSMLTVDEFKERALAPDNFPSLHFDKEIMYLISSIPSSLKEELQPRLNFVKDIKMNPTFWMSTAGSITQTHHDNREGLLVQIMGRKKVILFDSAVDLYKPSLQQEVKDDYGYITPDENQASVTSQLSNPELASEKEFPGLSNLEGYEVILAPGDIIYIPFRWWHYVRTLDFSISFNLAFYLVNPMEYELLVELLKRIPQAYYKFLLKA